MRNAAIKLRAKLEQRNLIDRVHFRLEDRRFRDFVRRLDASLAGSDGLARLMAVKAPWRAPAHRKA
jgi:uncharacterized protein (DUF1778 family)